MKTKPAGRSAATRTQTAKRATTEASREMDALLQKPLTTTPALPARAEGIGVGVLEAIGVDGSALVSIPAFGLVRVIARTLCVLQTEHVGCEVALGFESADPSRPIVLGAMLKNPEPATADALTVQVNERRLVVSADEVLELRCGDAVVRLNADGHIELRGTYITSHASATQRIRGGSVQIN